MKKQKITIAVEQKIVTTEIKKEIKELEIGGKYWTNGNGDTCNWSTGETTNNSTDVILKQYIEGQGFLVSDIYYSGEVHNNLRFVRTLWFDKNRTQLAGSFGPRASENTTIEITK